MAMPINPVRTRPTGHPPQIRSRILTVMLIFLANLGRDGVGCNFLHSLAYSKYKERE